MMLCRTEAGLEDEAKVAALAAAVGLKAEVCDAARVRELDPDAQMDGGCRMVRAGLSSRSAEISRSSSYGY